MGTNPTKTLFLFEWQSLLTMMTEKHLMMKQIVEQKKVDNMDILVHENLIAISTNISLLIGINPNLIYYGFLNVLLDTDGLSNAPN